MKKIKRSFRSLVGVALFVFLSPLTAGAAEFRHGDQVNIAANQIVNDDVYAAGGMISDAGTINGDLYAAGGSVLVTGKISSDAVVSSGNITITGEIGDDLRAAGGTIVIQSAVLGDVLVGGGQVHLAGNRVGGDVTIGGGQIRVDAGVSGDVWIGGGEVYLNGPVAGNVMAEADKLTLGPLAVIEGTLNYKSPKELVMEEGAVVKGKVTYTPKASRGAGARVAIFSGLMLAKLLMMLVGAFFFAFIFRRFMGEVVHIAYKEPFKEMGRGAVFLIVAPIVSIILLVTVIGIPLGVIGLLGFFIMIIVSMLLAPVVLGSFLYKWIIKRTNGAGEDEEREGGEIDVDEYEINWKSILLGVLAFFLMGFVPLIGGLAQCLLVLLTLGAAINMKWRVAKEWR